ncbi:MAG TPA: class I SAM-dependent methyltransferase [Candidatus Saccharimonadales bacterium]|nr:class I SAM-dependent methyltransferase [Candidatus Saccharimonadales bacterium]
MPINQPDWDERHRAIAADAPAEPATILRELLPILPSGPVLDLACGTGRHALLMAANHHVVSAVDFSGVALDLLQQRALLRNLSTSRVCNFPALGAPRTERILTLQANLEQIELPQDYFAVVVCIQYLQRSLFSEIQKTLKPGGILVFETFTRAQLELEGGPKNPAYLLETGELRTAFPALGTVFYRELRAEQAIASLVAQKPRRTGGRP